MLHPDVIILFLNKLFSLKIYESGLDHFRPKPDIALNPKKP
jgi:hypothetical protein